MTAAGRHVTLVPAVHYVYVPTTLAVALSYFVMRRIYKVPADY